MTFSIVIPARYASTRLPGKVLLDIAGKPMIQWVHDHATGSGAERVVVATDDERVAERVRGFGGQALMTAGAHRSGTERIAEVIERLRIPADAIVVNVQGDEPLMPPSLMRQVAQNLHEHPECVCATLREPIETNETLLDPNAVKVVTDQAGIALYFTRATVPWYREAFRAPPETRAPQPLHHRHIGLYAYRAGYVLGYVAMPPSPLEEAESLEQLRILWAGDRIHVASAQEPPGPGVDTEADLARARRLAGGGS